MLLSTPSHHNNNSTIHPSQKVSSNTITTIAAMNPPTRCCGIRFDPPLKEKESTAASAGICRFSLLMTSSSSSSNTSSNSNMSMKDSSMKQNNHDTTFIVDEGETLFGNDDILSQPHHEVELLDASNDFNSSSPNTTPNTTPSNPNNILQNNSSTNAQSLQLYWMMPMMMIQNSSSASSLESMSGVVSCVKDSQAHSLKRKLSEMETRSAPASFLSTTPSETDPTLQPPPRSKMRRLRKPQKLPSSISTASTLSSRSFSTPPLTTLNQQVRSQPPSTCLVVSAESTSQRLSSPPPHSSFDCSTSDKYSSETLLDQCFSESACDDDIFLKEEELSATFGCCESTGSGHSNSSSSPSSSMASTEETTDLFEMTKVLEDNNECHLNTNTCDDASTAANLTLLDSVIMMEDFTQNHNSPQTTLVTPQTTTSSALSEDFLFSSLGYENVNPMVTTNNNNNTNGQSSAMNTTFFAPLNGGAIALFPVQASMMCGAEMQAKNVIIPPPLLLKNNTSGASDATTSRNSATTTETPHVVVKKSLRRVSRNKQRQNLPNGDSTTFSSTSPTTSSSVSASSTATTAADASSTTSQQAHSSPSQENTKQDKKAHSSLPDVKPTTSKRHKSPTSNSQKSKSRTNTDSTTGLTVFTFCDGGYSIPSGKKTSSNNFVSESCKNSSNSSSGWKFHQFDRQKQPLRDSSGFTYHFYQPHSSKVTDDHNDH
ncbi:hypothetical protein FDP41_004737 [Naegleria fowleri]|uniref:Uncharacterized protein n=1 Tax=Naegleria fowleri TaxID=5763 RepID=A0A6A5BP65_NAEFO|nr:uncharacterized protein FDP41_004737 [Naegleria fowleri]KAF0976061.1 hypothetical protein FDP41_004737 [Naegleria fowleri]